MKDLSLSQSLKEHSFILTDKGNSGGVVTVGADPACDFNLGNNKIQDAINSAPVEIRIADNENYQENLIIDNIDIIIRGGFTDCSAANNNMQDTEIITTIDGSGNNSSVITVTTGEQTKNIHLENLTITGGNSANTGGGIDVSLSNIILQLSRVDIRENLSSNGAGIGARATNGFISTEIEIIAVNSHIESNQASNNGGGIYCIGDVTMTFSGNSNIIVNSAIRGGGMYLSSGCEISMYAGEFEDKISKISSFKGMGPFPGILANKSHDEGGGAYLTSGSKLFLNGQKTCINSQCIGSINPSIIFSSNIAGFENTESKNGGAIYLESTASATSQFFANGLSMAFNSTSGNGGGAYLGEGSTLNISRIAKYCRLSKCNLLFNNRSGTNIGLGGGIYNNNGNVNISSTYFSGNHADFGTAFYSTGDEAFSRFEGVVFEDNGGSAFGFSQNHVISASLGAAIEIIHTTIADNNANLSVFNIDPALTSTLKLHSSIVHDASTGDVLGQDHGPIDANCVMAHEHSSFIGDFTAVNDPEFIDRENGNFHLNALTSPAIDFCNDQTATILFNDIDFDERGWDDPNHNNILGPFDIGADETYENDIIYKDGFD